MFPRTGMQWLWLLQLLAGGTLGFIVNPVLWFSWLYVPWLAFLVGTFAQEGDFMADPPVTDEPQSRGGLQFNEDSRTLPFPLVMFGMEDWRLSPFWSGYAAAFYMSSVMWSSPMWWTMVVPIWGIGIARWSWVHKTSEESARRALTEAWPEWVAEKRHMRTYLLWHVLLCAPPTILLGIGWAMRRTR